MPVADPAPGSLAVAFLRRWFPDRPWVLSAIWPDGGLNAKPSETIGDCITRTFGPDETEAAETWIRERNAAGWNLYLQYATPIGRPDSKMSKKTVASCAWVWSDVDPPKICENLAAEREMIRSRLLEKRPVDVPEPTIIIDSGGGFQAAYRLAAAVPIDGDEGKAIEIEERNEWLEDRLHGDPACHDISRLLRLPFTWNWPDKKKIDRGRTKAWASVLKEDGPTHDIATLPRKAIEQSKKTPLCSTTSIEVDDLPVSVAVRAAIVSGITADEDWKFRGDRSSQLLWVVGELWRACVPDERIIATCLSAGYGISAHPLAQEDPRRAVERCLERARTDGGRLITNFKPAVNEKGEAIRLRLPIEDIIRNVAGLFGKRLFRMGSELLIDDDGVRSIDGPDALFAYLHGLGDVKWVGGHDEWGRNYVKEGQLFKALAGAAQEVDEVSGYPLEPVPPRVYITSKYSTEGESDGSTLEKLVNMFSPEDPVVDRVLVKAFILTLFWGGPPGMRPFFIISGPDNQVGKSKLVMILSSLIGGFLLIDPDDKQGDTPSKRILSDAAMRFRVVLFDNLDGKLNDREVASLVTSEKLDGRPSHGKQRLRANYIIWTATAIDVALNRDAATRSMIIRLKKPTFDANWEDRVRAFIDANREQIIRDCVALLRGARAAVDPTLHTRYPAWDLGVLAVSTDRPDNVLKMNRKRIGEADEDTEEVERFNQVIEEFKSAHTFKPHELASFWNGANGTNFAVSWAIRRIRAAQGKGDLTKTLTVLQPNTKGSPWSYTPMAPQGQNQMGR